MNRTLVFSAALASALVAGILVSISRNKSTEAPVAPATSVAAPAPNGSAPALAAPSAPLADATARPAEAAPTRTTAAAPTPPPAAVSSTPIPGAISNSSDDVGDPQSEMFARKYESRTEAERRAALTDIRNVLFGEDQIPADVKEGRLDPAARDTLKAEVAWLEAHPQP
jgi:hypothetical protein